jgi:hypothetical protein
MTAARVLRRGAFIRRDKKMIRNSLFIKINFTPSSK